MNFIRGLMQEMRTRGFWEVVRAVKGHRLGSSKHLVGEDHLGNRYYENRGDSYGRDRWVDYKEARPLRFDPLKVPPAWHAWLAHMVDEAPSKHPVAIPKYQGEITENFTGSSRAYVQPSSPLSPRFAGPERGKLETWTPGNRASNSADKDVLDLK
uniref:NADH dehydrogenase [ubiquinone] 1 alpha subcomplex subunit 12 n=1 Tax=Compsopogon caeruleus TaxID=31354 RepID=A0A7S1TEA9_9RHOD|mmetsp:Transcript_210/g.382  ORF Transcript_210/g.382 Transcript_210/m.382 type:complete len:155 (+) Transcript_210:83-547(+)|eukprot:CAMPEP_0184682044 /NCGR_PEP_ID=MMETSP0312-20130426/5580_1 /TAXON_ID=31354 /ORGANISM="Compsopogon coeruleus, Strain SAG 36.94" /LENGTH=154 /DNA_ID=CAMNT_0027133347 /DNA_START=35 /DNA_END=499 /DNA_ORIENTATION=+